jgi:hypothetical protein
VVVKVQLKHLVGVVDAELLKAVGLQESRAARRQPANLMQLLRNRTQQARKSWWRTLKFSKPKMSSTAMKFLALGLTVDLLMRLTSHSNSRVYVAFFTCENKYHSGAHDRREVGDGSANLRKRVTRVARRLWVQRNKRGGSSDGHGTGGENAGEIFDLQTPDLD